ncbi:MAG: phosphoribosylanthranilate isomerase [Bacteroidales bacterium]
MTDQKNMEEVARLGPDFLGFVFHPPSPRDVSGKISGLRFDRLPQGIKKVAVLVNPELETARALIGRYGFDAVQLHGEESPSLCRELQKDCLVIKSFSVGACLPDHVCEYEESADIFLFDTAGKSRGGNSEAFDHAILKNYGGQTPFFIAGGISPAHAASLDGLQALHPAFQKFAGADLNSRFEIRPGIKDPGLLSAFFEGFKRKGKEQNTVPDGTES